LIHLIHPSGNTFVRALLEGLEGSGVDYRFWTTVASASGGLAALLPRRIQVQLARRSYRTPRHKIETRPLREWVRLLAPALGLKHLSRHEQGWASVDAVYRDLDHTVAGRLRSDAQRPGSCVYAYEDGALECFAAAQQLGMQRAYELPIAYWETSRRLLEEEALRRPEWAPTLVGPEDSLAKLERKTRELELANVIVVPGGFVQRSLPGWLKADQRVVVAEFGSPETADLANPQPERSARGGLHPLRVLFAGSMSQRKGLADVFAAMRLLYSREVELVVMGSTVVPMAFYQSQSAGFTYEPPRPHAAVLELMCSCDVLVLPSIVEGRALVQQEALACGLPLIVSANAGGEDLVDEGRTGFLVPVRSPEDIAQSIDWFASHRGELEAMRPLCRAKAAEYTWQGYATKILRALGVSAADPADRFSSAGAL
jgi:glycosyltransferase involved in cell wall biosynthesis